MSELTRRTYFGGPLADRYRSRVRTFVDDVGSRAHDLGVAPPLASTDEDFFDAFSKVRVG